MKTSLILHFQRGRTAILNLQKKGPPQAKENSEWAILESLKV